MSSTVEEACIERRGQGESRESKLEWKHQSTPRCGGAGGAIQRYCRKEPKVRVSRDISLKCRGIQWHSILSLGCRHFWETGSPVYRVLQMQEQRLWGKDRSQVSAGFSCDCSSSTRELTVATRTKRSSMATFRKTVAFMNCRVRKTTTITPKIVHDPTLIDSVLAIPWIEVWYVAERVVDIFVRRL